MKSRFTIQNYLILIVFSLVEFLLLSTFAFSQSISITNPTNGKVFIHNAPIVINWVGTALDEIVKIEYSINNGISWELITDNAKNGEYIWDKQPDTNSYCIIRISTLPKPNGKYKQQFQLGGHYNDVYDLDWSPDGLKLVTVSWDGSVKLWDTKNGTLLYTMTGHGGKVYFSQFSPDGLKIATCGSDGVIIIWNAETGKMMRRLSGHYSLAWCAQWSKDSKRIVSSAQSGECIIWNAVSGTIEHQLLQHSGSVHRIQWNPENTKVASGGSDGTVKIWDANNGKLLHSLNQSQGVISVNWSNDGTKLAASGNYGSVKVWDPNNGNQLNSFGSHNGDVYDVQWNKSNDKLLTTAQDGNARILNVNTNSIDRTLFGHSLNVWNGRWNLDDSKVVTVSHDNTVIVWNAKNGSMISRLTNHTRDLNIAKWSPDSIRFASSADDMTAIIWSVDSSSISATSQPFFLEKAPAPPDTGYIVLYPDSRSAFPSTFVEIPIILSSALNVGPAGINTFDLDLNYNNTLLAPIGIKPTVVDKNISSVRLYGLPAVKGEIGKVKFRVGLGDADHCRLFLTNVVAHSGLAQYTILDGTFTLLGVCREGGDRLISTKKDTTVFLSINVTSTNILETTLSTFENGKYELQIVNVLGQNLHQEEFIVTNSSEKLVSIPIHHFTNGQYVLVLKTPSDQISKSFGIFR